MELDVQSFERESSPSDTTLHDEKEYTIIDPVNIKKETLQDTKICDICDKRFTQKYTLKRHVDNVHRKLKESTCGPCKLQFSRKHSLKRHLKLTKTHNVIDTFKFDSFITGHYHYRYIWTPRIGEELIGKHEPNNSYDKFAIAILKDDTIVGHVPREISSQFAELLESEGMVNVKVKANPVKTKRNGIRVPCTYIVSGKRIFVVNIMNNIANIC